uniref:Uncharacterized protein n=1 Tax=Solanum tuberosum TaxID=4113 RepID=M1BVM9_SOLTU
MNRLEKTNRELVDYSFSIMTLKLVTKMSNIEDKMDNRVYFRSGGKSYDITKFRSKAEVWYDWVESVRHRMMRMVLSRGALGWVYKRLTEASGIKGKAYKSWRLIMKEIGDRCGGWIETEEETDLKNHLRWARIRVKGLTKKIPLSIEIANEENIFSLPIWVEALVTFRRKYDEGACTSKERNEGGHRGRNPSDLSRCRNIHRSEKLHVIPNREDKVFLVQAVTGVEKSQKGPLQSKYKATWFKSWTKSFRHV